MLIYLQFLFKILSQIVIGLVIICALMALIPDFTAGTYFERISEYIVMLISFDLGLSLRGLPVTEEVFEATKITAFLLGISIVSICIITIPLGLLMINLKNNETDYFSTILNFISSIPVLIWATGFMLFYFLVLETVPIHEVYLNESITGKFIMALPLILSLILGDGLLNDIYQTVKSEGQSVDNQPFMKGIKARGLNYYYHQLRGILEPLVTVISAKLTYLISGIIIVENIFNWQGLGYLIWISIQREGTKDYGLILGTSIVIVFFISISTFVSDWIKLKLHPEYQVKNA